MAIETELKFRLPARSLAPLARGGISQFRTGTVERQRLVSTYFDTRKHKLKRRGMTIRIRQVGDKNLQTIKAQSPGSIDRGEWETEIGGSTPDLGKAAGTPLRKLAAKKLQRKLKPVFKTEVHRAVVPIRAHQAEIELAVDLGKIVSGRRAIPVAEIELELKDGPRAELFDLAKMLERRAQAELYLPSKAERGYDLATRKAELARGAEPIALQQGIETIEAFRIIVRSTMRHFVDNVDAVRLRDVEGIHQMRVGLRRTRAAISVFAAILPKAPTERIKTELKWLTNELAPARELDVFVRKKVDPAAHNAVTTRGARAMKAEFVSRRRKALERGRSTVNSSRYRRLLIDVIEWLESEKSPSPEAHGPIEDFAKDALRRRLKKIRKDGKRLEALSPQERHKLRIKAKKIRYALEFFDGLFTGKRDQKELAGLLKTLKALQDALGSLNDFAAHREMAAGAALQAPQAHRRARAFMAGVVLGREEEATKPVLQIAAKTIGRLGPVSAF